MRENYWMRRATSSRLSRRRFVGGTASLGAGAAALGLVGCGDDDDDGEPTAPPTGGTTTAGSPPAGSPTAGATSAAGDEKQRGGVARYSSANNTWDTFDSDRSRFTPFAVVLGYAYHGITQWDSFADGRLGGGFAESWENPDQTTFVFKLQPGLTWHDKPPVNGRAANMQDAVHFIERNKAGTTIDGSEDANFYRKPLFQIIESAEAVDDSTLRVTLAAPNPFLLNLFAGSYTKVQAPEAIEQFESTYQQFGAEKIIGTGSFKMDRFSAEGNLAFSRFDKAVINPWHDGIEYVPLFTDAAALQAAFEQKQIDAHTPRDVAVLNDIKSRFAGQVYDQSVFSANPMAGTYYAGSPPWSDLRLIGAMFRTIDRRALIQQLFQGRGVLSGNIPPTQSAFSIPESELITFPGYLEDRDKDLAEAKAMWEAAGGPALGEIIVDIPDIWEGAYSGVSSIITGQLKNNLGNNFTAKIETYATITTKLVQQQYGNGKNNVWWGWISEITDLEPSQSLYNTHNSASPQFQQFGVKIDRVDTLTNQLNTEFDQAARQEMCKEINRELLKNWGAGIWYNMVNISQTLYWNYYNAGEPVPFVTAQNYARDVWFNQNDPTWQGRPS